MKQHKTPVYVVNKHHKPLMPTYRFGHVRKLIKDGKAVAQTIKGDALMKFGFSAIGNTRSADELLGKAKGSTIERFMNDYKEKDIH